MRLNLKWFRLSSAILFTAVLLAGCAKDELAKPANDLSIDERGLTAGAGPVALIGLSPNNELINIMSGPPAVDQGVIPITGLRDGEFILGIDKRTKTAELFGVSNQNLLYKIDKTTGAALAVGATPFDPVINGELVGVDFNPQDDLLRVTTNTGQVLKISPTSGLVVGQESVLNLGNATHINSVAYMPVVGTTARPTLYEIDVATNSLYRQTSFGSLQLVGSTGYSWSGEGGFEITAGYVGYTAQYGESRGGTIGSEDTSQPAYRLHRIDLRTGKASSMGKVRPMIGITSK